MRIKLDRDYAKGEEIEVPETEIVRAYNSRAGRMGSSEVKRKNIMKRWDKYRLDHGTGKKVR